MDENYLGRIIRESRKMKGLTQEELAKSISLSTMSIRRYESGERKPTAEILLKIMDSIGEPYAIVSRSMLNEIKEERKPGDFSILIQAAMETAAQSRSDKIDDFIHNELGLMMIDLFEKLNHDGRSKAVDYMRDLSENSKYQRTEGIEKDTSTTQEKPPEG